MEKKRIRFIINPVSGVGKQKNIVADIAKHLDSALFHHEIVFTQKAGHAIGLAKQAAESNYYAVVSVGGDGSMNEVSCSLINSNTALAIIPTGSGNGFANHLGIPHKISEAIKVLNTGRVLDVDTVVANDKTVIGICGVGFDAHIAHEFANYGKRGFSSYVKVIMREFPKYKLALYKIEVNGEIIEEKAWLVTVANGSQFGNNATINPQSIITDGIMELCIVKPFEWWRFPILVYALFNNKIDRLPFITTIKADTITILNNDTTVAHIDGEPVHLGPEILFKVLPKSLKVIVPSNS